MTAAAPRATTTVAGGAEPSAGGAGGTEQAAGGAGGTEPHDKDIAVAAVRGLARTARVLERAAGDLGLSQYRVLSAIAAGEERASRVAERFGLGRPAVSAAVETLCRAGLVCRTGAATDQRAVDLTVTPAGQGVLDRVEEEMVRVLSDLCARSGSASPVELLEVLAALGPAVDHLLAERLGRRREGR